MAEIIFRGEAIPFEEVEKRSRFAAAALKERGLKAGDRVAVRIGNSPTFIEANRAIGYLGATPVPLALELTDPDFLLVLEREKFSAIVTTENILSSTPRHLTPTIAISSGEAWERLITSAHYSLDETSAPSGARFLTSGSTGIPKTVIRAALPQEIGELRQKRFISSWGMEHGMRTAATGPLYHQAPLYHILGSLAVAERVVLLESFNARTVLSAIQEHRLTHLHMVPRLLKKISDLSDAELDQFDTSSLKFVLHGAAACPIHVKNRLIEKWGPIFREYYATSEFGMVSQIDSPEWLSRPTSVGKAFEGVEIEIRDIASGVECPPATLGQVYMRSDDMPDYTYIEGRNELAGVIRKRGEFVTVGDVGYLDEGGYLHLTGRTDDIAVISGINFSAQATRLALLKQSAVDDALVIVEKDSDRGDRFVAYVRLKEDSPNITEMDLFNGITDHVHKLALPSAIAIVPELPAFDTGKLLTRYLDRDTANLQVTGESNSINPIFRPSTVSAFPAGVEVIHKPITGSTNSDALSSASPMSGPFTLVYADQQTSGRGRQDRSWTSPKGNLFWTMLVDCSMDNQADLGLVFVTALAVRDTIRAVVPANSPVQTKWPNDTLIHNRKVSGVLIESVQAPKLFRAVGVGINVEHFPPVGMMYPATSLRAEGSAATRDDVLTLLTSNFLGYVDLWRREGFEALKPSYLASAYRLGETVPVRQDDASIVTGVFTDVTQHGIVLGLEDGSQQVFATGDLIRPPVI